MIQMPLVSLPVRSTLVKENGKGILLSPINFDENQLSALKKMEPITDIVAPCLLHHLSIPKAHKAFPEAKLWGATGFDKKRPDIRWNEFLTEQNWPYKGFLDVLQIKGSPRTNELVFFHSSSRTLITMDLCFNLQSPKGAMGWLFFKLFGTYKKFAMSRLFKASIQDKAAFTKSIKKIFEWDFDRIIMAHGDVLPSGGKEILRAALKERGFDI